MYYVRRDNIGDICYTEYFVRCNLNELQKQGAAIEIRDLREDDSQILHAPLSITVNVTDKCNLQCEFCFYPFKGYERIMSKKTIDSIIRYVENNFVYELDVLGGEPLCNEAYENTLYLLRCAEETGCVEKIYLSSNAFFCQNVFYLCKERFKKLELSFSVQFGHVKTYTVEDVLRSFKYCDEAGIQYVISTVVDIETIRNKQCIVDFLKERSKCKALLLHYPSIYYSNVDFKNKTPSIEEFWNLIGELEKLTETAIAYDMPYSYMMKKTRLPGNLFDEIFCKCSGMYKKMEILPNGEVYPCCLLANNEKYKIGNINEKNFHYKKVLETETCSCKNDRCEYKEVCKVCYAYIEEWGKDERCPNYLQE